MKYLVIAVLCVTGSAAAQTVERRNGALVAADFNYATRIDRCAVEPQIDGPAVSARLFVRFQPDQRMAAGEGLALAIAPGAGGVAPVVSAHAINTKGTGGSNRRVVQQDCSASPAAARAAMPAAMRMSAAATCLVSSDASGAVWSFTSPIAEFGADAAAKNYTGHVTLIKRGDDAGGAKIVAQCTSGGAMRAGYDLAVAKK